MEAVDFYRILVTSCHDISSFNVLLDPKRIMFWWLAQLEHANGAYSDLDQTCLLGWHVSLTYVNMRRFSGDKAAFPEGEGGITR
jgi:hypothetical protein